MDLAPLHPLDRPGPLRDRLEMRRHAQRRPQPPGVPVRRLGSRRAPRYWSLVQTEFPSHLCGVAVV